MNTKSPILLGMFCLLTYMLQAQSLAPVEFIENKGQWDQQVRYMARVPGGELYLHGNSYTVVQHNGSDLDAIAEMLHPHESSDPATKFLGPKASQSRTIRSHAFRVEFAGAAKNPQIIADKPLPTYNNYFIGNDPSKWASHCQIFQGITVKNIYPNIDVRYYSDNGSMKYDLIVHPGGRVDQIALRFEGAEKLELEGRMLRVKTSVGPVREMEPYSYQFTSTGRKAVGNSFRIQGNTVSFQVKNYDPRETLIIDPTMIFSSFSKSTISNWGYTATYGSDGSFFGGGIVFGTGFPVNTGAYQQTYSGGPSDFPVDIGIIKLSPDGSTRMYATYIGGSEAEQPHSLIADEQGNLVIAGRSQSPNYPVKSGASGPSGDRFDIIVTKLNADGSDIIGSRKIGGANDDGVNINPAHGNPSSLKLNYGDDGRSEVNLDGAGNVYVTSSTQSPDFPLTPGAFQSTFGGATQDAVVMKFSANLGTIIFSSFLGGNGNDAGYVLSVNPVNGEIYVAGGTASSNFPGTDPGSLHQNKQGGIDGYVTRINATGTSIIRSTYIGTDTTDQVFGVKFDRFGFPYIMGQTLGNMPAINAAWSQSNARQFIAKLQPDLSNYVYRTTFGTSGASDPNISPVAFLVDRCENVYVSGWGGSLAGFASAGTSGMAVTSDAVLIAPRTSPQQTDGKDFYFFVLKKNATTQLYGSFFGQDGGLPDHVDGGTSRFDADGVIYQAICANCDPSPKPKFPTTPGAWGETNGSNQCNLAMVKIQLDLAGIKSGVQSAINGIPRDTAGCVPQIVDFRDTVLNAVSYEWDFDGDGITDTATKDPNARFIYNTVGNYRVRLIAIDSASCNVRDTSYMTIKIGILQAIPDFAPKKLDPCEQLNYQFTNITNQPPTRPFNDSSFVWDFGDGSPKVRAGYGPVTHRFPSPGSYKVRLTLVDTGYCNAPDFKDSTINISTTVKAAIKGPSNACAPITVKFENVSDGGQQFFWDFGDGSTSTLRDPLPHLYQNPGSYIVRLRVVDSATCNITDSATLTILAFSKPVAAIGAVTPQPPVVNKPISFTNASSADAIRFKWLFGDGDSLLTPSRTNVQHEYNDTKTYTAMLIAYNDKGCPDTAFRTVQTLTEPAIDVPTAFTPLSGDVNSVVFARGFNIGKIRFTIYNRWGQKVFDTADRKVGWDGKFKGVLQPMDVYAYTLEVEFTDGKKAFKKGDITLIR